MGTDLKAEGFGGFGGWWIWIIIIIIILFCFRRRPCDP